MRVLQLLLAGCLLFGGPFGAGAAPVQAAPAAAASPAGETFQNKLERTREILNTEREGGAAPGEKRSAAEDLTHTGIRLFMGLLLCIGVLAVGVYAAKRLGFKPVTAAGRKIKLIERTALTARTALVLAEVEGRSVLLAVGAEHVALLEVKNASFLGDAIDLSTTSPAKEG